jgi:hypothetical protein
MRRPIEAGTRAAQSPQLQEMTGAYRSGKKWIAIKVLPLAYHVLIRLAELTLVAASS